MAGFSNAWEQKILEAIGLAVSITAPTQLDFSLHSGDPGESGTANELSGGNYSRASLATGSSNFNAVDATTDAPRSLITNKTDIVFPPSGVASADWSIATYVGVWDHNGGTPVYIMTCQFTGGGLHVLSGGTGRLMGGATGQLALKVD